LRCCYFVFDNYQCESKAIAEVSQERMRLIKEAVERGDPEVIVPAYPANAINEYVDNLTRWPYAINISTDRHPIPA